MGAYKEFIELNTTTGKRIYLKVAYIESVVDKGDKRIINVTGDSFYEVKETYEEIKRMLDE